MSSLMTYQVSTAASIVIVTIHGRTTCSFTAVHVKEIPAISDTMLADRMTGMHLLTPHQLIEDVDADENAEVEA